MQKQLIKVKNGGKIWLGGEGDNVLQILRELIQVVADIANTAKDHTYEYTDKGSPLKTKKARTIGRFWWGEGGTDELKGRLDPVVEQI